MPNPHLSFQESCENFFAEEAQKAAERRAKFLEEEDRGVAETRARFFIAEAEKEEKCRKVEKLKEAEAQPRDWRFSSARNAVPFPIMTSFPESSSSSWAPVSPHAYRRMLSLIDGNARPSVTLGRAARPENPIGISNNPSRTSVAQSWLGQWRFPRASNTPARHVSGTQDRAAMRVSRGSHQAGLRLATRSVEAADLNESGGESEEDLWGERVKG